MFAKIQKFVEWLFTKLFKLGVIAIILYMVYLLIYAIKTALR